MTFHRHSAHGAGPIFSPNNVALKATSQSSLVWKNVRKNKRFLIIIILTGNEIGENSNKEIVVLILVAFGFLGFGFCWF